MKFINTQLNRRLTWDEFFMGVAILSSMRSKDPNTQVGACIVRDHKILSTGYNGMPRACNDDDLPLTNQGRWLDTKYPYIVHAELNAILNATTMLTDAIMYTTLFPCSECAKAILQAGIKTVYYLEDKHPDQDTFIAARKLLLLGNVNVIKYETNCDSEAKS